MGHKTKQNGSSAHGLFGKDPNPDPDPDPDPTTGIFKVERGGGGGTKQWGTDTLGDLWKG